MSILLDALKKSEQQRQLGTTPTIYSNVDGRSGDAGELHRWVPVAMSVLTAVVITWIGWNQYQAPFNVLDASGEPPDTTAIEERENALAEEKAGAEAAGDDAGAEALAAVDEPETRPPGFRSPMKSFRPGTGQPPAVTVMPANPDSQGQDQRQRLSQSFSNYRAEESVAGEDAVESGETTSPGGQAAEPIEASGAPRTANTTNRRMEPAEPEPVSYWSLPQGVRDNLPEFKISVLVYAEQPRDRFLLMNGKRWMEDESEGGVRLAEIRRDGAVFLYQKYRFLVKG